MESAPTPPEPSFLTVREAASRMALPTEIVRGLCREGKLPGAFQDYRHGPWRISAKAVDAWVQQYPSIGTNDLGLTENSTGPTSQPASLEATPIGPPKWWERFRHHPLVFYPTVLFIVLAAIVAVVGVIISSGADYSGFRQQLRAWGIPIREFAGASEGETLIVIATFHTTVANTEPHTHIRRAIEAEAAKHGEQDIRVAVEPTELSADQRSQAEALGRLYEASMVIWGEDTGVKTIVRFLDLKQPDHPLASVSIEDTADSQIANPERYVTFVTENLPDVVTFLALFAIGQSYYLDGEYELAIDRTEAAIAVLPPNAIPDGVAEAYFLLGLLYQATSQHEKSLPNYNKAIELNPDDAAAYNNRGAARADQGDLDAAIADLDMAIQLNPDFAEAYYNRGNARRLQGDLNAAIADYDKAIQLDPGDAEAYFNRGGVRVLQGDLDEAIADFDKAIQHDPGYAEAYYNRGLARTFQGDLDAAIADFDKAIQLDSGYAEAYYNRGVVRYDQGNLDVAIADYNKAIQFNPDFAEAYYNRGNVHLARSDLDAAIADYDKAIELDPGYAKAYGNRGVAHSDQGDLDAAIADYDKAIELDPNHDYAYYNRANARVAQGDLDGALADYRHYLQLRPNAENRAQVEQMIAELEAQGAK